MYVDGHQHKAHKTEKAHKHEEVHAQPEKEDKKEKKKNKKKEADPNGLKRPLSAYMLYNNFRRPALKEADTSKFLPWIFEIIMPVFLLTWLNRSVSALSVQDYWWGVEEIHRWTETGK